MEFQPIPKLLVDHLAKVESRHKRLIAASSFCQSYLSKGKLNVHLQSVHPFFLRPSRLMSMSNLVVFISQLVI